MVVSSSENLEEIVLVPEKRESTAYLSLARSLDNYFERKLKNPNDYSGLAHGIYTSLCAVSAIRVANGEKAIDLSGYSELLSSQPPPDAPEMRLLAFELSDVGYDALYKFASRMKYWLSSPHYTAMANIVRKNPSRFEDLYCKINSNPENYEKIIAEAGALDTMLLISYLIESGSFEFP